MVLRWWSSCGLGGITGSLWWRFWWWRWCGGWMLRFLMRRSVGVITGRCVALLLGRGVGIAGVVVQVSGRGVAAGFCNGRNVELWV